MRARGSEGRGVGEGGWRFGGVNVLCLPVNGGCGEFCVSKFGPRLKRQCGALFNC